jgi:hypothetical protein
VDREEIDLEGPHEAVIKAIKDRFQVEVEHHQPTLDHYCIDQLESCPMKMMLEKLKVSEEDLRNECDDQATLVKHWKRDTLELKVKSIFHRIFPAVVGFFRNLLDTIVTSFGYDKVGEETQTQWEASEILKLYLEVLLLPSALFLVILPFVSTPVTAAIITAAIVVVALAAFFLYVNYFKPCPENLDGFANLTALAERGKINTVLGRNKETDQTISVLEREKGVALIGPPGVGKTVIPYGLAERIASGDVPKALKGKKVFYINAARLAHSYSFAYIEEIEKRLKNHEKDVILIFDEIASGFKDEKNLLPEHLKTLVTKFPYCIIITTDHEYKKYKIGSDPAFKRRFDIVPVKEMSKEQIEVVLNQHLQMKKPHIQNQKGIIPYLIDQVKTLPETNSEVYLSVMNEALLMLHTDINNTLKNKISDIDAQIDSLTSNYLRELSDIDRSSMRKSAEEIRGRETERKTLEEEQKKQNKLVQEVESVQALWNDVRGELANLAIQIQALKETPEQANGLLLKWTVKQHFVLPALEKLIDEYAQSLIKYGIKVRIDQEMINSIISKLKINQEIQKDLQKNTSSEDKIQHVASVQK